jgi:signal transduction histidine kinase
MQLEDPSRVDLQTISWETSRCKKIVSSLLDFARQQRVDVTDLDLNQLLKEVVARERNHQRYNRIDLALDLDQNLPLIQADEHQIQSVIINLMTNAADAMPGGGNLLIKSRKGVNHQVVIEVEDDGEGIPPEDQSQLFTPFFTTKPPGEGTGLGLSIVYGIIKMHKGHIDVQSRPGKGTRFIISLPEKQLTFELSSYKNGEFSPDQMVIS